MSQGGIIMNLQGKKVLVFGSGKSGIGAAELLGQVGAEPVIYDGNADLDKEAVVHKVKHCKDIRVYAGELPQEVRKALDLVVLSPGVPTDIPIVKSFYEQGLPVWGEVELAYRTGKGRVLAITGTNGKTTTTAKLAGKFKLKGKKPLLVACDVYRPAAIKQLEINGEKQGVEVFSMGDKIKPADIAKAAMEHAAKNKNNIVILDTAGRLHID